MTETKTNYDSSGNHARATSKSPRIRTPEELIEYLGLDMDKWVVERAIVNKWEVGAKHPDNGHIMVEPLWQVKLWLVLKRPEPVFPVIQPIKIDDFPTMNPVARRASRKKAVLGFDLHFGYSKDLYTGELTPFHDRKAISILMQICAHLKPNLVALGGDVLDLAEQSDKFLRSPDLRWTTQPAIIEAAWVLAGCRKHSRNGVVIEGNHDRRLYTSLLSHFDHAYELRPANKLDEPPPMSIRALLALDDMGMQWMGDYPNDRYQVNNVLQVMHGDIVRSNPGATAKAILEREGRSTAFGHTHRRELVSKTMNGKHTEVITAFNPGCLCRIDGLVPGSKPGQSWQQGLAVVEYDDDNFNVELVPIDDGYAYFRGKHFIAQDYMKKLKRHPYFK